jgi:hypothetical protein
MDINRKSIGLENMKLQFLVPLMLFLSISVYSQSVTTKFDVVLPMDSLGINNPDWLGSNKDFTKNYFLHYVTQKSGFKEIDVKPLNTCVLLATNQSGKLLWHSELRIDGKNFKIGVSFPTITDDILIMNIFCFEGDIVYYNNEALNSKSQYRFRCFLNSNGEKLPYSLEVIDSKEQNKLLRISNFTNDNTFAIVYKKFGDLFINNQQVEGESGVYISLLQLDKSLKKLKLIKSKRIAGIGNNGSNYAKYSIDFDCQISESKRIVLSNTMNNKIEYYFYNNKSGIDTVYNYEANLFFYNSDLEYITNRKIGDYNDVIQYDSNENVYVLSNIGDFIWGNNYSILTVFDSKMTKILSDTLHNGIASNTRFNMSVFENGCYLFSNNLYGNNDSLHTFRIKQLLLKKNTQKFFESNEIQIPTDQFSLNTIQPISSNKTQLTFINYFDKGFMFDFEKGIIENSEHKNGYVVSTLEFDDSAASTLSTFRALTQYPFTFRIQELPQEMITVRPYDTIPYTVIVSTFSGEIVKELVNQNSETNIMYSDLPKGKYTVTAISAKGKNCYLINVE